MLVAIAGAVAWRWGPAYEGYFDSAFYLDGARHLARGDGYVSAVTAPDRFDYEPITHWAPGLPILIAAAIRLGLEPLQAASAVLWTCYVAAVLLVYLLGIQLAGAKAWPVSLLASLVFALQPSTLRWMNALLSDLPAATFLLLNVLLAARVARAIRPSKSLLIVWGSTLAAMAVIRYAGMLFVPGLLIATVAAAQAQPKPWYARAWSLWPTVLVCALGIGLLSARNHSAVSQPFGQWMIVRSEVSVHLERALKGAFAWLEEALVPARALGVSVLVQALLWIAAACLAALLVLSWRSAWRRLCFLALPAAGYFLSMIATSSTMLIAKLTETRFWIPVWPLTFLVCVLAVAHARAQTQNWLARVLELGVVAALLGCLGLFVTQAYRTLPRYDQRRGLSNERWQRAASVLPEPGACRLFVMDPRPFMLHRELGPTSQFPLSLAEFDAAANLHASLCVVVIDKRLKLSASAEQRRVQQTAVVAALKSQKRLERLARANRITVYRLRPPPAAAPVQ